MNATQYHLFLRNTIIMWILKRIYLCFVHHIHKIFIFILQIWSWSRSYFIDIYHMIIAWIDCTVLDFLFVTFAPYIWKQWTWKCLRYCWEQIAEDNNHVCIVYEINDHYIDYYYYLWRILYSVIKAILWRVINIVQVLLYCTFVIFHH